MGIFEQFPYTNFHELNLDWILRALKELEHTIEQFVAINALKYADPIQWNITSQYEKNTIVIDPVTGTAYISVQPVPAGVALTNTNYWTVVFDLSAFIIKAAKNFTNNYEESTTLTATFPSTVKSWLIWGEELYVVINPINAGDAYVVNSNIKRFTIEEILGHNEDLNTTNKDTLVNAINELLQDLINEANRVDSITGDLNDLSTTDKTNLVNAINEVLTTISTEIVNIVGNLTDLNTQDQTNIVNAINETVGEIDDLKDTTDLLKGCINFSKPSFYTYGTDSNIQSMGYNSNTNQYVAVDGLYPTQTIILFDGNLDGITTYTPSFASAGLEDFHYDPEHDCYWTGDNSPASIHKVATDFSLIDTYYINTNGVEAVGYHNNIIVVMTADSTIELYDVSSGFDHIKTLSFVHPYPNGIQGCAFDGKLIYAPSYFITGNHYTNLLYIIDADTGDYRIQFIDYWHNNAEMQGCFIAKGKLNIYGTSDTYSGKNWWLSICDFYSIGDAPVLPNEGSGTPLHIWVNENYTSRGNDGYSEATALYSMKDALFRLNYGMPNIISCKNLNKGSGETYTVYGMDISIEGDSSAPQCNWVFSRCTVNISTLSMLKYIQFVDHTKAKLINCGVDNIYVEDSELNLDSCYFAATAGPNTDTLYVTRGTVRMTNCTSASYTQGEIKAGIVISDTTPYAMNLTLLEGSQHFT